MHDIELCPACVDDENIFCPRDVDAECVHCGLGCCAGHILQYLRHDHCVTASLAHCSTDGAKAEVEVD